MPSTSGWMTKQPAMIHLNAMQMTSLSIAAVKKKQNRLLEELKARMQEYELTLHPEKTKIVYCKNYRRNERA